MKPTGSARDPQWYKDAIIYETHVKAFFDSNNDGIGDFAGLEQKLDYLQDLGVTCLWLLPFFPSPLKDDGYDISDYRSVHSSYGTLDDFRRFLQVAHERGLQVIIELVVNHTSDQHPWFQAARAAPPGSPARDYYVWSDSDQKYSGARIIFTDTERSNWTWDAQANAYYWHRFFSHQPDLNFDNPLVLKEVVEAMRFWLDMGVDGLRLDAIPYLIEREGTNCENLTETHALIKQIRRAVDENYANRMMLAEANQWPSDVIQYFGGGDECHMAFHFPLMPRLFMALRLEDRHPITEILDQTPRIPADCQWGIFLRNHDELTLEMVTDEERDYMYYAYSADPRMRINVGIRRRLAPLMENNRRRIELLSSILFSFPGTPILYYGDEIGMGDNIYLGDRNGVRTPMQWSADRNAGFSRAVPQRLYSPVIMDPTYGYEAVNVEAQQSDPSSLLHWMRNMIGLRKIYRVFGRGTIDFIRPQNRKVLVYLRRYQGEQILCVANLSRFSQPVELDLQEIAGMVPIEMLGYSEFPAIGRGPYPLTLGPYGFYWFELQGQPEATEVTTQRAEPEAVLTVGDDPWASLMNGVARASLETNFLSRFLTEQRWFAAKSRSIKSVRIADWVRLPDTSSAALAFLRVEYESGDPETYFVPLAVRFGEEAARLSADTPKAVVCEIARGQERGVLIDGAFENAACLALLDLMERGAEIPSELRGAVRGEPAEVLPALRGEGELAVRRGSAEQTNTSILFDRRLILKLFRRVSAGVNPDVEIGRFLTGTAGFERTPKLAGSIEYAPRQGEPCALAMLQELVDIQGDGWSRTLEWIGRYFEERSMSVLEEAPGMARRGPLLGGTEPFDLPDAVHETVGIFLEAAGRLGVRTAEMHLALSSGTGPAFAPEPLGTEELSALAAEFRAHAARCLDQLKGSLPQLPDELVDKAGALLSRRRRVLELFDQLAGINVEKGRIRIHGDYHLGQVLVAGRDFYIIDFEGEPARSAAERRAKHSPLKDVAGMLRSFSYAAYSALLAHVARRPDQPEKLEGWARLWIDAVSNVFLNAYLDTAGGAFFLPSKRDETARLLDAYLLDKALYELRYEMDNRPDWVRIPLNGILPLVMNR